MRIMLLSILLALTSCSSIPAAPPKAIWARITYYHCKEDRFGAKVACDSKMRNKEGYGVSAHPDFKFFTKIRIPALKGVLDRDDEFTVIDRGRDVTRKKASKGRTYVFDIYVAKTGRSFTKFISKLPTYAWVIIK